VVILGVSTSQFLLMILAALSLLVFVALLWMNHRTPLVARPVVVLRQSGVLCPVDLVSRRPQAIALRMPARAPPTFPIPSIPLVLDAPDPVEALMDRRALDSAEMFR